MSLKLDTKFEEYQITRLALQGAIEMSNINVATRCIRKICSVYEQDYPVLIPLKNDCIAFIEELTQKGEFKSDEISRKEAIHYGDKAQDLLTRFYALDSQCSLGEVNDGALN